MHGGKIIWPEEHLDPGGGVKGLPVLAAAAVVLAGCVSTTQPLAETGLAPLPPPTDLVSLCFAGFHGYDAMRASLERLEGKHDGLVEVEGIGTSVDGREIVAAVVTDESAAGPKLAVVFDGQHHGDEPHAGENMIHLAWWLAENAQHPAVSEWLRTTEIWIVPFVNVDGHEAFIRENSNGVDLNRNYDLDWGNPGGTVYSTSDPGSAPFSEPESRAIRDLTLRLKGKLAVYNTNHIARHSLAVPWAAFEPPFEIPAQHDAVFQEIVRWTLANTEYEAGRAGYTQPEADLPYAASGTSFDWVYAEHRIPTALLETYDRTQHGFLSWASDRVPAMPEDHNYWAHASLPVYAFFIHNAAKLKAWETSLEDPPLPAGIPPAPTIRGTPAVCASSVRVDDGAPAGKAMT